MNVFFITAWYSTQDIPTSGIFVQEYAKAVCASGNRIIVIYCRRGKLPVHLLRKVQSGRILLSEHDLALISGK